MASTASLPLPKYQAGQDAYVRITPFDTGRMAGPIASLVKGHKGTSTVTSWRFFIAHEKSKTKLWFDMGISDGLSDYVPATQHVHRAFTASPSPTSIVQDTESLSVSPSEVTYFIISHAHWDHIFPLPTSFTHATMIVGPGSISAYSPGYPSSKDSERDGRIWDSTLRRFPLTELPPTTDTASWAPLGPFPHAHDFFNDGSLYLLDAPGHMTGNLAALCRVLTKSGTPKWILLGGDCAHCNVFTYWPETPFGEMSKTLFPSGTLHERAEEARETIRRIAECKRVEGEELLVWYAHGELLEGVWEL